MSNHCRFSCSEGLVYVGQCDFVQRPCNEYALFSAVYKLTILHYIWLHYITKVQAVLPTGTRSKLQLDPHHQHIRTIKCLQTFSLLLFFQCFFQNVSSGWLNLRQHPVTTCVPARRTNTQTHLRDRTDSYVWWCTSITVHRGATDASVSDQSQVSFRVAFYPRDALHSAVFAVVWCLSVCLSHAGIVFKWRNLA